MKEKFVFAENKEIFSVKKSLTSIACKGFVKQNNP